ncbi:MAG: indolepyruvate oxidoreductase subunit beta [Gemmatimonadetes bacterium]|nr:indolepyruvate oxidoreductase subunit beta [Gemmatimonadota bacterium]
MSQDIRSAESGLPGLDRPRNVFLTGVGGHGVLAVSRVIAEAALASGFDVRRSEVHGMSQRGGSVVSQVRYGARVHSPLIARGTADVLVALELLEARRHLQTQRASGVLLANEQRITPAPIGGLTVDYPADPKGICEGRVSRSVFLPALDMARELGDEKAANMVMLGAYSVLAPEIPERTWRETIAAAFRPRFRALNVSAFECGREATARSTGQEATR